MVQNNANR